MPRLHKKGWKQQCFLHKRRFHQLITADFKTLRHNKKYYNVLFSGVLQLRSHITDEVIKRRPSSLCCSRLHSQIEALDTQRDAVIGEYSGAEKNKWIRSDHTAEQSRTLEQQSLCSILLLPPPTIHLQNKEAEREEARLQVELCTDAPGTSELMLNCL